MDSVSKLIGLKCPFVTIGTTNVSNRNKIALCSWLGFYTATQRSNKILLERTVELQDEISSVSLWCCAAGRAISTVQCGDARHLQQEEERKVSSSHPNENACGGELLWNMRMDDVGCEKSRHEPDQFVNGCCSARISTREDPRCFSRHPAPGYTCQRDGSSGTYSLIATSCSILYSHHVMRWSRRTIPVKERHGLCKP